MGANKGRRAKSLFKSYYVALDNKAMAEYPSAPEIIEKHVYYHPDKGIEKTVYYPDAPDKGVERNAYPEGVEQRISHLTVRKEEHEPSTEVGKRAGSIHLGSTNTSPRDCNQRSFSVQEPAQVDRHPEGPTFVQETSRTAETLTQTGNLAQSNARVDAASAFQRWRQGHLQRTFNQELRRVSENSRKDEASMTMVEEERAQREKSLAYALAESASLCAQLSAKEQEIRVLQSHRPVEDLQNLPNRATSAMEYEAEPSDRRIHQPPETHQVCSEEDLVWINEPQVHAHNQEFSALSHHLRELMGEIISLEHRAGNVVSFSEVYEAIRNVEQGLDLKMKGKLRRPSRRGSDSWHQPVEDVDYSGRRNIRTYSQNELRKFDGEREQQQRRTRTPKDRTSQYQRERDEEAFYRANDGSKSDKIGKSVVWKWRWALASSKAKTLSRHLKSLKALYKAQLSRNIHAEASSSVSNQELTESGKLKSSMEKELLSIIPGYSFVSFIVSLWRAYSVCTKTQKTFLSRLIPIDRIMAAFPLWVENVGDRQVLLYFFSLWQLASLKRGRKRGTSWSPRRSPRRRNTTSSSTIQELGPSIYESFHHCCHPNSPSEANRCSPTRMRTPRSPSEVKSSRQVRPRQPARSRRGQQDAEDEETDSNARCIPISGGHDNGEANRGDCVSNVNEESPSSSFETVGMAEMFHANAPIALTGQTFSAQALRKLQLQLQHELQDMQPILAKATKAIQNQIVVDQNGKYANESKRANSMASLWKICSTVEYALTEARNQMLSIIHDSARGYHNGVEELDEQMLPEESLCEEVERVTSLAVPSKAQPTVQETTSAPPPPPGKSYGFQSVFNLLSKTSGLQSLRRKSCLAAQYAVGLNHKIHHLKQHRRGWQ